MDISMLQRVLEAATRRPDALALGALLGVAGCGDGAAQDPRGAASVRPPAAADASCACGDDDGDGAVIAEDGGDGGGEDAAPLDAGADASGAGGDDGGVIGADARLDGSGEADGGTSAVEADAAEDSAAPVEERVGCPARPTIDCDELGVDLVGHSCFHAELGPFAEVGATHVDAAELPKVDTPHTHFTVGLPAPSGEGAVGYTPRRGGNWAIFSDTGAGLRVLDATGAAVLPSLCHPVRGCAQLPDVGVYALSANVLYRVVLRAPATASVPLVLEYLDDFKTIFLLDRDGDGYGGDSLESWLYTECVPPGGYVRLGSHTDCDDERRDIHPEAAELCDGIDNDCSGGVDEGC